MTIGPATLLAIIASALAVLMLFVGRRLALNEYVVFFLYGVALAVVILAGPLIRLP